MFYTRVHIHCYIACSPPPLLLPLPQDLHYELEDMMEQTSEIMDVMGRPYGLPDDVDEDDLEAGEGGRVVRSVRGGGW